MTGETQPAVIDVVSEVESHSRLRQVLAIGSTLLAVGAFGLSASAENSGVASRPRIETGNPYQPSAEAATYTSSALNEHAIMVTIARQGQQRRAFASFIKVVSTPEFKWHQQATAANADGKYDRLAHCESGGQWNKYSTGGLGNKHWSQWRLPGMPDSAGAATKDQQIVVAEEMRWRIRPIGSFRGTKWTCAVQAGLP